MAGDRLTEEHVMRRFAIFVCLMVAVAGASAARAEGIEFINPFGKMGTVRLTEKDRSLLRAVMYRLLESGKDQAVGAWRNDATGNFGTVEVKGTYHANGRLCRVVTLIVKLTGEKDTRRLTLSYCKDAENHWRIAS
jgi:surface antigen